MRFTSKIKPKESTGKTELPFQRAKFSKGILTPAKISSLIPSENKITKVPSRELTYPTWGKGKPSSKVPLGGDMLVPTKVYVLWEHDH